MRLTKEAKEYIHNLLEKKLSDDQSIKDMKLRVKQQQEEIEQEQQRILDEATEKLQALAQRYGCPKTVESYGRQEPICAVVSKSYWPNHTALRKELKEMENTKYNHMKDVEQDIIGRIALGGDADELLAMIDEITF